MKFSSRYFKTTKQLHAEKERLWDNDRPRRENDAEVRGFYNGKEIKTVGEAERDDSAGIINHLLGYRNLQRIVDGAFAIYSTTNSLIEIQAKTGQAEVDVTTGSKLAEVINEAIYHSGEFESLWASCSGEGGLAGKSPLLFGRHGWCPSMSPNVLVPENSPKVPKKITYLFAPLELSMVVL